MRIDGKPKDLGGFTVARLLPHHARRTVGACIFFDHLGPADFAPGTGIDVRPHPHIGLATVTYLFAGRIGHKDSLGTVKEIGPGAVNWMTAGRGISHSERTPDAERASGQHVHGIQTWMALPVAHEDDAPAFDHYPADTLPVLEQDGVRLTLIAGEAYGLKSPVPFPHPSFYVDADVKAGAKVDMPEGYAERALYVAMGEVVMDNGEIVSAGTMLVLPDNGGDVHFLADQDSRVMLIGGAPLDGPRHIYWNLVSSDPAKIEAAKAEWAADPFGGRWGTVPGENEFIPLPD